MRITRYLLVFGLLLFAILFGLPDRAFAALNGTIDRFGPATGSSSEGRSWFAVGNGACPLTPNSCDGGFQGPDTIIDLYVNVDVPLVITIENPSGGCSVNVDSYSDSTTSTRFDFYANGGVNRTLRYGNAGQVCGTTTNLGIGRGTPVSFDGNTFFRVRLRVDIVSNKPFLENSFRVNIVNTNATKAYVSIAARQDNFFTGLYQKDSPGDWSQAIDFAPPNACSASGGIVQGTIAWFDADFRTYNGGQPMAINIFSAQKGTSNWSKTPVFSWTTLAQIGDSGPGSLRSYPRNYDINYKYRMVWSGVDPINTIQVRLPFDQINSTLSPPDCITYKGDGSIDEQNCRIIRFTPRWNPSKSGPITGSISITGAGVTAQKPFSGTSGIAISYNPFTDPAFSNLPIHGPDYSVNLSVQGELVDTKSFNGCLSDITCTYINDYEYGDKVDFPLTYSVNQSTTRTSDNRYKVVLSEPPPPVGILGSTSWVYTLLDYSPTRTTSISGTLTYNGLAIPGLTAMCNVTVSRYPYMKSYGADVVVGGGFRNAKTCGNQGAGIFTNMRPIGENNLSPDNKSGSGAQLATLSYGDITSGFVSSALRAGADPSASSGYGLTLGGTSPIIPTRSAQVGQALGINDAPCNPDYFTDKQFAISDPRRVVDNGVVINQGNSNGIYNNKQVVMKGTVTLNQALNFAGRTTYFIDGDLIIAGNVNYVSYATIQEIPNLTVLVRGNIYINPGVESLDGVYIAQPDNDNSKGVIYTCDDGSGLFVKNSVTNYQRCSGDYGEPGDAKIKQLVISGSVIARRVVLNRAVNTLTDSKFREPLINTKAAEVFNFSPEVMLAPPIFANTNSPTSGVYNSIALLPPTL